MRGVSLKFRTSSLDLLLSSTINSKQDTKTFREMGREKRENIIL